MHYYYNYARVIADKFTYAISVYVYISTYFMSLLIDIILATVANDLLGSYKPTINHMYNHDIIT